MERGSAPSFRILREMRRHIEDGNFEVLKMVDFLPVQTMWICQRRDKR